MASFGPRKRTRADIISGLPVEIKHQILTKLPIKDAVRTSILSSNWRYTWATIPDIVVTDDDLMPTVDESAPWSVYGASLHFVESLNFLLFTHNGPIQKFYVSTKCHCPGAFDRWILNLSRNGITELIFLLNSASLFKYRITSNFFCCDKLRHVHLSRCLIELPRGFEGFKLLISLRLNRCTISAADLEWLVASSSRLEDLMLEYFEIKGDLRIVSNGLTYLAVIGAFSDLQIEAPNLISLFVGNASYKTLPPTVPCLNKFCKSLGGLLNIRHVGLFTLQYLVDSSPAVLLNSCLTELSSVTTMVDLADQGESRFTCSLLQNATNLQDLDLFVKMPGNTTSLNLWEKDIDFESIRVVIIRNFKASEPALAFVKFILSSTPNLRKLTLMENPEEPKEGNPEMLKRLFMLQRASTRAEVTFE